MTRTPIPALLTALLLGSSAAAQSRPGLAPAAGPPPGPEAATVRGESAQTRKRLIELEQQIRAGKTADAADELQRLLDEAGDDLIAVDAHSYAPARRYVQRFLAQLPPAALAAYRDRIEEPARKLLDQGRTNRDPQPLRQLLDRYLVSRPGEDALSLLGDLAFERGEFRAAEGYWRRLTPDASPDDLPYPAPRTDPAAARAKVALAAIFQGDVERARGLVAALRERHPEAAGRLAGRNGKYADTLAALLAHPPELPPATAGTGSWTTLGGDPDRDGRPHGRMSYYWPSGPAWITPIPRDPAADHDSEPAKPPPVGAARSVAFHPVVVGDRAYLADAGRVIAFDLSTGRAAVAYDIRREDPFCMPVGDLKLPVRFDADFGLTAAGTSLYARLGPAALFPPTPADQAGAKRISYIVRLDVAADGGVHPRWSKDPPAQAGTVAAWEGAPAVAGGRVIAAYARSDGGRVIHALACLDEAGRRVWATDVCESPAGPGADTRRRHELVSLAGPNAVFCSHTGVVAAVDARTGKPAWAFRYPQARRAVGPTPTLHRDVNPPVAADGRVFVAPTDGDALYAFDADTGRLLWREGPILVAQLVGVAAGKVVCTLAGPVPGVRGFDAATGSSTAPRGWANHDDPGLASFGRGLLSDEWFVWPTEAGMYVLRLADGSLARQPIRGLAGNLAFADGRLLCATPTDLRAFVSPWRPPPARRPQTAPGSMPERWALTPAKSTAVDAPVAPGLSDSAPASPGPQPFGERPRLDIPPAVTTAPHTLTPPEGVDSDAGLPLSSEVRTDSRVVARAGECHLLAIDRRTGRVVWVLDAQQRPRYDPAAWWPTRRFLPPVYADDANVVAFTAYGRRWIIDAASGTVTHDRPGPAPEFVSAPVRVTADLVAAPTGPGQVEVFYLATGATAWRYDADRPASLMGVAPRVWVAGDSVFVAVVRNFGVEIDRLGSADGRSYWRAGPAFVPAGAINPAAVDVGAEHLYVPVGNRLLTFWLDTGGPTWEAELPAAPGGWTVRTAANAVAVLPTVAIPADPAAAWRVVRTFALRPDVCRLPGLLATLYDAWIDRTVPVLLFDPATGRRLHRVDLPARGPAVATHLSADGLTVLTGRATYRLK